MAVNVLDALPVAVLQVSPDGRICYSNDRARALLAEAGLTLDDAQLAAVLAPGSSAEGQVERGQLRLARSSHTLGYQAAALEDGGRVVVLQDLTRLEQTTQERNRLLQMASVSDVMPAVLHELKNPLAGINAALELMVEDASGAQQEQLHAILVEVRRLALTIDGLGRFRHEVRSARNVAIDEALREAFSLLVPQAKARQIEATLAVEDMPLLPFEAAALRAVVFNLVTNSLHACGPGRHISLKGRFDREQGVLHLAVVDDGSGMTPEVLARCTELFFTTKPKGSGIGLALCQGVAEAVGGRMLVESAPGVGTTVTMTLPVLRKATNVPNR